MTNKYLAEQRTRQERYRERGNALIRLAKSQPCADCGVTYPFYVMDLDHVRGDKVANLAKMKHRNPEKILAEIAKCDVVCSNCHRERTYSRQHRLTE